MDYRGRHQIAIGTAISFLFIIVFVAWSELDVNTLRRATKEDGPIENLSAIFSVCQAYVLSCSLAAMIF